jgi:hypothetical protein
MFDIYSVQYNMNTLQWLAKHFAIQQSKDSHVQLNLAKPSALQQSAESHAQPKQDKPSAIQYNNLQTVMPSPCWKKPLLYNNLQAVMSTVQPKLVEPSALQQSTGSHVHCPAQAGRTLCFTTIYRQSCPA